METMEAFILGPMSDKPDFAKFKYGKAYVSYCIKQLNEDD